MSAPDEPDHLVPLGGSGWALWRDVALRSAGFPAEQVLALRDDELADAADDDVRYATVFDEALARLAAALKDTTAGPRFREALAWQNPDLVRTLLDREKWEGRRNARRRGHELAIATYLQRYCLKNDTIGFFGPVGWASVTPDSDRLELVTGRTLVKEASVYFEVWAINELARAVTQDPDVFVWLSPRTNPANVVIGNLLHRPGREPLALAPREIAILELCDGRRTVSDLGARGAEATRPDVEQVVRRLCDLGAVTVDLDLPIQAYPEEDLRRRLARIGDPVVRERALEPLAELMAARDKLATAVGDADGVMLATTSLEETFQRFTGQASTREHGRTYAGRTLLYLDTVRDIDVRVGRVVLDAMAGPMSAVLTGGRWLARTAGERYRQQFLALHSGDDMPLIELVGELFPDVTSVSRAMQPTVAPVVAEFQRRWQQVLRVPDGVRRHSVRLEDVEQEVAEQFACGPALWSAARNHSPDVMIAGDGVDAVSRGDFVVVLGEIHLACNTIESRLFVEQHPDRARVFTGVAADHGGRRIYGIEPRDSPFVTSRVAPPSALLSPEYTYWSWSASPDSVEPPAAVLPAADLVVDRRGAELVVRSRTTGDTFDFLEVIGELLSEAVVNAFKPLPPAPHRPRISIDRFVLCRESWTFRAAEAPWAFIPDERDRYAEARRWRRRNELPERLFFKVPTEKKPCSVDFRSLPLVNVFAKALRRTAEAGPSLTFTLGEMLPDLDELWLRDGEDNRYTCELRFIAVDQG
ncbi:lantibiotic dehydratase [Amycolatopsis sp. NPDC004169]|uniref:lantibiotic dehydratase n=1 Tax=Amycolatopsis sp. NPDC004169 TaxID=3154453 RepID=UPI0033B5A62F